LRVSVDESVIAAGVAAIALSPLSLKVGTDTVLAWTALVFSVIVAAGLVVAVLFSIVFEVRFRITRGEWVSECFDAVQRTAIPVWAVLADRVWVSGGGDTVYDLQFVFDLRVPRSSLELQVLGLATDDPRIAETLSADRVVFMRDQLKVLRKHSRIARTRKL